MVPRAAGNFISLTPGPDHICPAVPLAPYQICAERAVVRAAGQGQGRAGPADAGLPGGGGLGQLRTAGGQLPEGGLGGRAGGGAVGDQALAGVGDLQDLGPSPR
jgi:hypothetical protein